MRTVIEKSFRKFIQKKKQEAEQELAEIGDRNAFYAKAIDILYGKIKVKRGRHLPFALDFLL